MARIFVLCVLLLATISLVCGQIVLSNNIRTVNVDPLNSKITFTVSVETDDTVSVPELSLRLDGSRENDEDAFDINGDPLVDPEITVSLNVVPVPVKTKNPTKAPTKKPSKTVSAAGLSAFSPLMGLASLAAAAICRGFSQSNKMSVGIFVVATLILAFSTSTKAASNFEAKRCDLTIGLPIGWTSDETLPYDVKMKNNDRPFLLFPPTPSPSGSASRSLSRSVSRAASPSPSPSRSH